MKKLEAGKVLRVFGPPGTGKTTHLSHRIERAAERFGAENVVVSSFTKAAAAELNSRKLPIPKENIGTLHSLCFRALGNPTIAETKIKEWNEAQPHYRLATSGVDAMDESLADQTYENDADRIMGDYQRLRARMIERELWPEHVEQFATRWETWKAELGYIDFTDMIETALEEIHTAPGNPQVGFFDEFQDFTKLQVSLVLKWAEEMDFVMLAGDDDQSIYQFNGASPNTFLDIEVPEKFDTVLNQSHRVPSPIKKMAEKWIKQVSRRHEKSYRSTDKEGKVEKLAATYIYPEPILKTLEAAMLTDQTTMIITSCGYQLNPIIKVLRREGIPYHNPYRPKKWNPLGRRKNAKSSADRLLAFLDPILPPPRKHGVLYDEPFIPTLWQNTKQIDAWAQILKSKGIMKHGAKKIIGTRDEEFFRPDIEAVDYLKELFVVEVVDFLSDTENIDLDWLIQNAVASKAKSFEYPAKIFKKRGPQALVDQPKVIIGTIHSVKGGEADNVILFPDISTAAYQGWLRHGEDRDAMIRVFYVAMTRARKNLYLCNPATRMHMRIQ